MSNWAHNWGNCIYCGVAIRRTVLPPRKGQRNKHSIPARSSREHIFPQSKGGWLVVPACSPCNGQRSSLRLSEFWASAWLQERRAWAENTPGYRRHAPASELARLYLRGKPPGTKVIGFSFSL